MVEAQRKLRPSVSWDNIWAGGGVQQQQQRRVEIVEHGKGHWRFATEKLTIAFALVELGGPAHFSQIFCLDHSMFMFIVTVQG